MRFAGVPLAVALLSCCFFCAAAAAAASSAADSAAAASSSSSSTAASPSSSGKPKRDAGLSFSSYHGPSHKYLPPTYEGHQLSYGGGGGYHGNSLSSYSTDFGHLESEGSSHHYGHGGGHHGYGYGSGSPSLGAGHGHGRPVSHHYVPSPKIETYIVQTSSGPNSGHGYHGHSAGHGLGHGLSHGVSHGVSHGFSHGSSHGLGYKYPAPGSSGGAGSSAYLNLLGGGHKTSTYLVASPEYSGGSVHRPSSGSSYSSHAPPSHGYSHGFGHGFGHGIGHGIGHHQISSHGPSSHVASHSLDHSLEHALEHGLSQALGLGHSSGGSGGGGGGGPVFAQHPLPQPAEEHSGYTYDAPATPFGKGTPLSSYGVPLIPGYDHQESLQEQVLEQEQKLEREQERETPVYALGHKGLGHFSYTASKPQALHTDVLGGGVSHSSHSSHSDLELTKAPFKPSAFLGAKHESAASGPGSNSISGYDYATPTSPYLQAPSSPGYDYQAPAQLYGPPGHSGDSATPIFEPEATYLPPASSYGPPATSSHGYH